MKEGRFMLTSEVVVMAGDIVKFERDTNTNNKAEKDVGHTSNGVGNETLSWSISDLVVLQGQDRVTSQGRDRDVVVTSIRLK